MFLSKSYFFQGIFQRIWIAGLHGTGPSGREDWMSNAVRLQWIQILRQPFGNTKEGISTNPFSGNPLRWFWPDSLEHIPLHHNGDRGVDLPLPLLGQFQTICQLNVLSICKLSVHTGPNILTQRWLSSVEHLVSSLVSPSSPFGTDLLPSSPYRQNIEQPPNYYLWVYLVLESNISSIWKLSSPSCKTSLAVI